MHNIRDIHNTHVNIYRSHNNADSAIDRINTQSKSF